MTMQPVTLEGQFVRLEPLTLSHCEALWAVAQDESIWRWTLSAVRSLEDMRDYIETALTEQAAGKSQPFATIERASSTVIGSTRYMNIELPHRGLDQPRARCGRGADPPGAVVAAPDRSVHAHPRLVAGRHRGRASAADR